MLKVTSDFYVAEAPRLAGGQKNEAVKKTVTMSNLRNMQAALDLYLTAIENNYEKLQQVRAVFTKLLLQALGYAQSRDAQARLQTLYNAAAAREAELRLVDAAQWSAFEDFALRPHAQGEVDKLSKSLKEANKLVWDQHAKLQKEHAHVLQTLQEVDRVLGASNLAAQERDFQARRAQLDERQWESLEAEVKRLLAGTTLRGGCDCADAVLGSTA